MSDSTFVKKYLDKVDKILDKDSNWIEMQDALRKADEEHVKAQQRFNEIQEQLWDSTNILHPLVMDISRGRYEDGKVEPLLAVTYGLANSEGKPQPEGFFSHARDSYSRSLPESHTKQSDIQAFTDTLDSLRKIHENGDIKKFLFALSSAKECSDALKGFKTLESAANNYHAALIDKVISAESAAREDGKPRPSTVSKKDLAIGTAAVLAGTAAGGSLAVKEARRREANEARYKR